MYIADGRTDSAGPDQQHAAESGTAAPEGDQRRYCSRLTLRGAALLTAAALIVVAIVTVVPAIVVSTSGSHHSDASSSGSSHSSQELSPQILNQSEVVVYTNLLQAAAFQDALFSRIVSTPQLGRVQGFLETTIQSHGNYTAHLSNMLTASGTDTWRGAANVDAAFFYDLSYGNDDRAAANRSKIAALLAASILTAVKERLVSDARELLSSSTGAQLAAASGHNTEAQDALVREFKADLKFAERLHDLKGFLTSNPGLVLQLSTSLGYSNATVSMTAAELAYMPSATYAGERRRLFHTSRRILQDGSSWQVPNNSFFDIVNNIIAAMY